MEEDSTVVENRRYERINNMIETKSCFRNDDFPENKAICLRIQTY